MASRLASTPIAAISGAWKATSSSRKPRARTTPITSGVFAASAARGRSSRPPGPRSARRRAARRGAARPSSPSAGLEDGDGNRRDQRHPSAPGCAGPTAAMPASARAPPRPRRPRRRGDHLEGARRAVSERGLDPLVALARGIALGHDLDRGHPVSRRRTGSASPTSSDEGDAAEQERTAPQPLAPAREPGRAVLAAVDPRKRQPVDAGAELRQHRRQQRQRCRKHEDHRDHDPQRHPAEGGARNQHHSKSEISTVRAENRTALPAVSIVRATASSGGSFGPKWAPRKRMTMNSA